MKERGVLGAFIAGGVFILLGFAWIVTGEANINWGWIKLSGRVARILGAVLVLVGLAMVALQARTML